MTDTTKRYRLLKDLPDAEIGREFVYNKTYNKYFLDGNVLGSNWDTEWVENNPTWFTEVLPVSEPVTEKIKVGKMCCIVGGEGYGEMKWDLRFKTNKHIHYDKAMKLCNALESALNDTVVEVDVKNWGVFSAPPLIKMYSQSEVDAIRKKAGLHYFREGYIHTTKKKLNTHNPLTIMPL